MKRAILTDHPPNLYVLHYDLTAWAVRTVILIPHFAFALSAIERRPPLAPTARRAGWVGCNILLDKIPAHARIPVVSEGTPHAPREVRAGYNRLRPLEKLHAEKRGGPSTCSKSCNPWANPHSLSPTSTPTPASWRSSIPTTPTSAPKSANNSNSSATSASSPSSAPENIH